MVSERATRSQFVRWIMVFAIPLAIFVLFHILEHLDRELETPLGHVFIVGGTSLIGAFIAFHAGAAAHRRQDSRALLLSLAFFTVSGFSAVHTLLTPGVFVTVSSTGLGWTQAGGYLAGAALLALSSLSLQPRTRQLIFRARYIAYAALLVALVASLWISIRYPNLMFAGADPSFSYTATKEAAAEEVEGEDHEYATPNAWLVWGTTVPTLALLGVAAYRYVQDFRLTRLPLAAMVVSGMLWLADGQIGFATSETWYLSWWMYHALIFLGFGTILLGVIRHMGKGTSLSEAMMTLFLQDTVEKLESGYNDTLIAMIAAVEAKDSYTRGHSARVTLLVTLMGEALRLSPDHLRILHQTALLHDVGKIGIPDGILNKPGRLTEEEYAIVKEHPVEGEIILKSVPSLQPMLGGVRSHHERWDGLGYPDGLAGESIPLDGRIIAVADVFDALTSARAYRPAWPFSRAVDEIKQGAGTAFDPRMVEAFLSALPRYMEQLKRQPHLAREVAVA